MGKHERMLGSRLWPGRRIWTLPHRTFLDQLLAHSDRQEADRVLMKNTLDHLQEDLDDISDRIERQVSNDLTNLNETAQYYFTRRGKRFRPALILLMHHALRSHLNSTHDGIENAKLLAQAAEMIHTASLVHDDILDEASERRGQTALPVAHGNQAAVLCGDYLLAKANLTLSEIGNPEVHVQMSQVLVELVQGEFMQLNHFSSFQDYVKKSYYKSASMMARSCASVALLSNASEEVVQSVQEYGGHVGMSFQLKDDLLDMTGKGATMGKAPLNDLKMGLITAPTYYAMEEDPEIATLLTQSHAPHSETLVQEVVQRIEKTSAIEKTEELISEYTEKAIQSLSCLSPSPAFWILQDIAAVVGIRSL